MNPFEYMQSLAELWGRSGKDLAAAQQGMFFDMAGRMAKATGQDGASGFAPANLFDPQGLTKAGEGFATLWSSAIELSQTVTRNMQKGDKQDPLVTEMLGKIFDPRAWFAGTGGMDEALQRMAEGPRLADLWDTERKMLNVFNAWAALRRRSLEHNTVMLEAWLQAAGQFAKDLGEKADRKETLASWRELLALWVETANITLLETQRSEAYLNSQREIPQGKHRSAPCTAGDRRLLQRDVRLPDARRARRCASDRDRASARAACSAARRPRCAESRGAREQPSEAGKAGRSQKGHPIMTDSGASIHLKPEQAISEAAALGEKIARGAELFSKLRDDEVAIATTPKDEVWRQDKVTLHHYRPLAETKVATPVLIVYGLIGRYTMADLQEDRSLVRNLLNLGIDLYVVDWGNPSRADRWLTLDDYIDGYLGECVRVISERHKIEKVSLLGICEGGVFTTCYAALHPDAVKAMVLTITPIDFHGDTVENRLGHGFINIWTRSLKPEDIDRLIEAYGNLPGEFMGSVFSQMTPMRTLMKYNLDMLEVMDDEKKFLNFLRMEKWIADRPHHPGEAAKQWLKDLYQDNKLINNAFMINGRQVDLGNIVMPVLNVFAKDDHIIPPATSQALGAKVGTKDYTELALPGGHVGVFVGGKSQALLGSGIAKWLSERQ